MKIGHRIKELTVTSITIRKGWAAEKRTASGKDLHVTFPRLHFTSLEAYPDLTSNSTSLCQNTRSLPHTWFSPKSVRLDWVKKMGKYSESW